MDNKQFQKIAKALADPRRFEIFQTITTAASADGMCCGQVCEKMPGALKNAIDWTVSSGEFSGKPTALITASLGGEKAHESLLLTLKTVEAVIGENSALLIQYSRTKVNAEGAVSDAAAIEALNLLIESFIQTVGAE